MQVFTLDQIDGINPLQWNQAAGSNNPFLKHEFLLALEQHGCVGEETGWIPRHQILQDDSGTVLGATPMYLKTNSYGEFVFDWAWADAFERTGRRYYPKMVAAIPYTPANGPRLLVNPLADRAIVARMLIKNILETATDAGLSSVHYLFTSDEDTKDLVERGFMRRTGCHFHWHNQGYTDFEDFLADLSSKKRKQIRRERRQVRDAGIEMRIITGAEATDVQWQIMHYFYCSTFERKSGIPTLTLEFFREISRTMGDEVILVFAYRHGEPVAGAINLRGTDTFYGRHWGCLEYHNSLHFETCYYQGIDYCIRHGLSRFEPGAQGEHKLSRGFLPTLTWSAHWIADEQFREAIHRYLQHEHDAILDYRTEMMDRSPYRDALDPVDSGCSPNGKITN